MDQGAADDEFGPLLYRNKREAGLVADAPEEA
jgi:hypothetical protein